jgi:hypothetical protein
MGVDWAAWQGVGLWIDAVSGVIFILLGAWVGWTRPRTRAALAFAAMTVGWGVRYSVGNLVYLGALPSVPPWNVIYVAGTLVSIAALLWIVFEFPKRVGKDERRALAAPALVAVVLLAATLVLHLGFGARPASESYTPNSLSGAADDLSIMAWTVLLFFLFLRQRRADAATQRVVYLVSLGLSLMPAVSSGRELVIVAQLLGADDVATLVMRALRPVLILALAAAWLFSGGDAERRRRGRNMALVTLGAQAFGALLAAWAGPAVSNDLGIHGLARLAGAGVLAYAILQHQLFDINVKLRFGIKHSTIAAIFIALFVGVQTFVSEFFTDEAGLIGGAIVTAALVFAITPLQRLGDRVAERAVPNARPLSQRTAAERTAFYRALAESAWADGSLTRSERRVLDAARSRLGLDAATAAHIEAKLARR